MTMSGGRLELGFKSYLRNFNPLAKLIGINKATIRKARREFLKDYATDETKKAKLLKKLEETITKTKVIDEAEREFEELRLICVHKLHTDAEVLTELIIPVRDDFLKLREMQRVEDIPKLREFDRDLMKKFLGSTQTWFSGIASHKSLTIQLSDMVSLRQEVSHILDPLNLQMTQRRFDRDLDAAKKEAQRHHKSAKEEQEEAKKLEKVKADAENYLKMLDVIWRDMTRLMQLEAENNQNLFLELYKKLQESGLDKAAPETYKKIFSNYTIQRDLAEEAFREVQKVLNTLVIIENTK